MTSHCRTSPSSSLFFFLLNILIPTIVRSAYERLNASISERLYKM
jgi:hypothetical protein